MIGVAPLPEPPKVIFGTEPARFVAAYDWTILGYGSAEPEFGLTMLTRILEFFPDSLDGLSAPMKLTLITTPVLACNAPTVLVRWPPNRCDDCLMIPL